MQSRLAFMGLLAIASVAALQITGVAAQSAPDPGKTVSEVKSSRLQDGEPVEDVAGVGEAAIYRPQANSVTVEKKNKAGELQWLEVRVQNVEGADRDAVTKRMAIELAKRGAARL